MIKRDITETIYEYDKEGKLVKKIVTETHEEEEGTTLTYPYYPLTNPCISSSEAPTATLSSQITYSNTTTTD